MDQKTASTSRPARISGLALFLFFIGLTAYAQQAKSDAGETIYTVVEHNPEFPGGLTAMKNYLAMQVHYPDSAAKAHIRGRVFVSFVVERDGQLTHIDLLKGLDYWCEEEAIRVIKAMPRWIPGTQSGRAIRVKFNLPIFFGPQ